MPFECAPASANPVSNELNAELGYKNEGANLKEKYQYRAETGLD
jgi:hypothetical protein